MNGTFYWRRLLVSIIAFALGAALVVPVAVAPPAQAGTGAAIAGSVLGINDDPTGVNAWDDPLPGVRVAVFDAATNAFVKGVDTNTLGQYKISDLPAKALKVRFTKTGWLTAWRPGTVTPVGGTTTNLGENTIYAEALVSGGVLANFDPPPIASARVTVFDATTGAVVAAVTTEPHFTIGGLPAGTFYLRATATGYLPGWSGHFTLVAGEHAGINPEFDGKIFLLEIDPEAVVQGSVVNAAAAALPGVRVVVTDAATGAVLAAANTDAQGKYRIGGMPANGRQVKVSFSKAGFPTVAYPQTITLPNENYYPVEPTDLGSTTLIAGAAISGEVLSWMDPIGGARVTVFNATTGAVLAAKQLGEYETTYRIGGLPAGPIKVRATKTGYIDAWAGPYTLVAGQELKQSWDPMVLYLDMAPAVVLQGTVVGSNTAKGWTGPLSGVRVLLTDKATGAAVAAVTTDASGRYRFNALVPMQTVKVTFTKSGWLTTTHPAEVTLWPYSNPIGLGTTTMHAPAAISGQVLSQMDPISGARVTVFNATTGAVITAINADGEGNYRVGGLPAGPVKVRATKTGYKDAWANYPAATFAQAKTYTLVSGQQLQQTWSPTADLYLDLMPTP